MNKKNLIDVVILVFAFASVSFVGFVDEPVCSLPICKTQ